MLISVRMRFGSLTKHCNGHSTEINIEIFEKINQTAAFIKFKFALWPCCCCCHNFFIALSNWVWNNSFHNHQHRMQISWKTLSFDSLKGNNINFIHSIWIFFIKLSFKRKGLWIPIDRYVIFSIPYSACIFILEIIDSWLRAVDWTIKMIRVEWVSWRAIVWLLFGALNLLFMV